MICAHFLLACLIPSSIVLPWPKLKPYEKEPMFSSAFRKRNGYLRKTFNNAFF